MKPSDGRLEAGLSYSVLVVVLARMVLALLLTVQNDLWEVGVRRIHDERAGCSGERFCLSLSLMNLDVLSTGL